MAWEVWSDTHPERSYGQMGFFCNTADVSFGPVFLTDDFFDKGEFYKLWEKAGFRDPRKRDVTDADISKQTRHLLQLLSWDDNILATMKVSRSDGVNAPVILFEQVEKTAYQNLDFSPYQKPLERLSEDDFTILETLMEDTVNDMKWLILSEDPYDDDKEVTTYQEDLRGTGLRVEMKWEVLDEY